MGRKATQFSAMLRSWRMSEFTDLPLNPALFQGLDALGHVQMTPIQGQSLPAMLEGRDLIGAELEAVGEHRARLRR